MMIYCIIFYDSRCFFCVCFFFIWGGGSYDSTKFVWPFYSRTALLFQNELKHGHCKQV